MSFNLALSFLSLSNTRELSESYLLIYKISESIFSSVTLNPGITLFSSVIDLKNGDNFIDNKCTGDVWLDMIIYLWQQQGSEQL
jgi:hypothetical protein